MVCPLPVLNRAIGNDGDSAEVVVGVWAHVILEPDCVPRPELFALKFESFIFRQVSELIHPIHQTFLLDISDASRLDPQVLEAKVILRHKLGVVQPYICIRAIFGEQLSRLFGFDSFLIHRNVANEIDFQVLEFWL